MRKKQQSKNVSKEDMWSKIQEWYTTLREILIRTGKDDYDEKWGIVSSCPIVLDSNRTYQFTENQHNEKVYMSLSGAGLDKGRYSLQIWFSPKGKQPPLGIVFRGNTYQNNNTFSGTKMFMCYFKKMYG